jgi:cytoskeletal protein RodZ
VAKKKRGKRNWLRLLLFFILTPFITWALAFLIWFYWYEITGRDKTPPTKANKEFERPTKPSDKSAQERIGEEDRRKLEDILKSKK